MTIRLTNLSRTWVKNRRYRLWENMKQMGPTKRLQTAQYLKSSNGQILADLLKHYSVPEINLLYGGKNPELIRENPCIIIAPLITQPLKKLGFL